MENRWSKFDVISLCTVNEFVKPATFSRQYIFFINLIKKITGLFDPECMGLQQMKNKSPEDLFAKNTNRENLLVY